MAEFPRYNSQRQMTTQRATAFTKGDYRTEAKAKGQVATQALSVAQQATELWENALTTSQLNAFKSNKGVFLADLKSRAMLEVDQNAGGNYVKELEDWKKDALKDMGQRAKAKATLELDTDYSMAQNQINGIFQKKIIAQSQINLAGAIEGYKGEALATSSKAEATKSITAAVDQINQNVKDGIISPDEGESLRKKFTEELRTGEIERDLYSDPMDFKAKVKKDAYIFANAKEKSDYLKKADTIIKAEENLAKWEEKQLYTMGAYEASKGLLDRSLTSQGIKDMYNNGKIDSETAAIFDEVLTNKDFLVPDSTKLGKPDFFLKLLDDALDDETESLAVMKQAARAYGKTELGSNQYGYFINEANKKFERLKKGQKQGDGVLRNIVNGIKSYVGNTPKRTFEQHKIQSDMLRSFIDKIMGNTPPEEAAEEVIMEQTVKDVQESAGPEQRIWATDGKERLYSDDGDNWFKENGEPYK